MGNLASMPKYKAYRNSRIEWLGFVPSHWNKVPLCSISKLKSIVNQPHEQLLSVYLDKGVIRFDDVDAKRTNATSTDLSKYQLVEPSDFVLNNQQAWRGSVGVSSLRGIVSPAYLVLELSKDLYPQYANYLFRDGSMVANYLINSKGVGTIQRNLYWPQLKRALIFLPTFEEQVLISNFLDKKTTQIDQAISIKEHQINLLKERKQIIIQKAAMQGLDPNVVLKESGVDWIGKIPEHWEIKRLKYILEERGERSKTGEEPLFMVSQIHGLVVRADYHDKTEVAASNIDNKVVYKNDLVFNKLKAHLGVFFKSSIEFKGLVSPDYAVYKCKNHIADAKYLEILFRHPSYIEQFIIRATGIVEGLIRLYTGDLFDIHVPVAPVEEQLAILAYAGEQSKTYDLAIELQQTQIEKLKEYKTTLINSAVTGKIKITPEMAEQ
ncbi:restriction endonuclease subunit S [Klebsiella pneumoniae]|nr:restriction endonuclease subunit S [Klebsiella pneumoniae]KKY85650.1 restriction endonuclease subunit S [Klebsiella variicola]HCC4819260.1 restriction endonuclease subunit S [Klebsiella pneumoniae]